VGVEFKSGESTSKVLDPRNGALNFPAAAVSAELSSVLRGAFFATLWRGVISSVLASSVETEAGHIGSFVVDKSLNFSSKGAIGDSLEGAISCRIIRLS